MSKQLRGVATGRPKKRPARCYVVAAQPADLSHYKIKAMPSAEFASTNIAARQTYRFFAILPSMKLFPCAWFFVFLTVLVPPAFSKTAEDLEPRLDQIERDIRRINSALSSIKSGQSALSRQIDSVKHRLDSVDRKVDDLDSGVGNLKSRVSDLRRR